MLKLWFLQNAKVNGHEYFGVAVLYSASGTPWGIFETPFRCREQAGNVFAGESNKRERRIREHVPVENKRKLLARSRILKKRVSNTPMRLCFQGNHSRPFETTERVCVFLACSGMLNWVSNMPMESMALHCMHQSPIHGLTAPNAA
jgi:hypothetical protein